MNKNELGALVASRTGFSTKDTLFIIDLILATMRNGLCKEERLELRGLGSFEVRKRAARKGRILATGEMVDIPGYKTVVFVPGKSLKKFYLCNHIILPQRSQRIHKGHKENL